MNSAKTLSGNRPSKIANWILAASAALLPMLASADEMSAASLAFRPVQEQHAAVSTNSRSPTANTSVSANLAFRSASEQVARSSAGFAKPLASAGAAEVAFRAPVRDKLNPNVSMTPFFEVANSRPAANN